MCRHTWFSWTSNFGRREAGLVLWVELESKGSVHDIITNLALLGIFARDSRHVREEAYKDGFDRNGLVLGIGLDVGLVFSCYENDGLNFLHFPLT